MIVNAIDVSKISVSVKYRETSLLDGVWRTIWAYFNTDLCFRHDTYGTIQPSIILSNISFKISAIALPKSSLNGTRKCRGLSETQIGDPSRAHLYDRLCIVGSSLVNQRSPNCIPSFNDILLYRQQMGLSFKEQLQKTSFHSIYYIVRLFLIAVVLFIMMFSIGCYHFVLFTEVFEGAYLRKEQNYKRFTYCVL